MMSTKLTESQIEMFESVGSLVYSKDDEIYMNIPYWIKETEKKGVYEIFDIGELPQDVREQITSAGE